MAKVDKRRKQGGAGAKAAQAPRYPFAPLPLVHGWTGGQYSLLRAVLAMVLIGHWLSLLPWAATAPATTALQGPPSAGHWLAWLPNIFSLAGGSWLALAIIFSGLVAAVALLLGWHDRPAALVLFYLLAAQAASLPLWSAGCLLLLAGVLLLHASLPAAPYGSLAAAGRSNPGGGWRWPPALFAACWLVLGVVYAWWGLAQLADPAWRDGTALLAHLQHPETPATWAGAALLAMPEPVLKLLSWLILGLALGFLPLLLISRSRPWLWLAMLGVHLLALAIGYGIGIPHGALLAHLWLFMPAWLPPRRQLLTVFYDGQCGFCHCAVRLLLAEDRGQHLRFAPWHGVTWERLPRHRRQQLPDSLVVHTPRGDLLTEGAAVRYLMDQLGGLYRLLGFGLTPLPKAWQDRLYRLLAKYRRRLFAAPEAACPLVPPHLKARFLP